MRVVLVHGRAASLEIPDLMRLSWERAMRYGLERIGSRFATALGDRDIRFAFYGNVWRPDEQQPLPAIAGTPPENELAFPGIGDIALWLDEHLGVGDTLLERLLTDTNQYYGSRELREKSNEAVVTACREGLTAKDKVVLIGFSMGSLVSYDVLRRDPDLPVAALITCGSPLGMPAFYRRVRDTAPEGIPHPTPFPAQLDVWVNVWTQDDAGTAGHARIGQLYRSSQGQGFVQDLEAWGRSASPSSPLGAHNALDYLSSRSLATALHSSLRLIESRA